ncbi:MAG: OmpA family protein [Acidobacteria bacterium]|nr:OmpA family protein [Acidobacteriota bacterium]MBI3472227.1 OmpA family protein [Candidatus Solibacter usitatus]
MSSKRKSAAVLMSIFLVLFAAGCKKKPAPPPPPPPAPKPVEAPPPPKRPTINQFSAEPSSIERGQSATLRWSVSDATEVRIDPALGVVQSNGNRTVFPSNTTQYTLTARGPGGDATATASVNVTAPPPPPPPPPPPVTRDFTRELETRVQDAYFDYDKSDIRDDARSTLSRNADSLKAILRDFPQKTITVEGHCDERGSAEYNLGLGDRRSTAAKEFLGQLGVPADRLKPVSYGKERPQCTETNETCWQKNRRAHFAPGQ